MGLALRGMGGPRMEPPGPMGCHPPPIPVQDWDQGNGALLSSSGAVSPGQGRMNSSEGRPRLYREMGKCGLSSVNPSVGATKGVLVPPGWHMCGVWLELLLETAFSRLGIEEDPRLWHCGTVRPYAGGCPMYFAELVLGSCIQPPAHHLGWRKSCPPVAPGELP